MIDEVKEAKGFVVDLGGVRRSHKHADTQTNIKRRGAGKERAAPLPVLRQVSFVDTKDKKELRLCLLYRSLSVAS